MPTPTGAISFNDVRTEMSQSFNNYGFYQFSIGTVGDGTSANPIYTPVNVHSTQYTVVANTNLNAWKGYDRTLNYASDGTNRTLYEAFYPGSNMILFDLGTTNKTWDITISGSVNDFSNTSALSAWYGKFWKQNGGSGTGDASLVYENSSPYASGINTTINYSYTYDSAKGQYLYIVVYGGAF